MAEPFLVRTATEGDYDGVGALLGEVDELHRLNVPWLFQRPAAEPRSNDFFQRLCESDDQALLVADAAGHVVGAATVLVRAAPDLALFVPQSWGVLDNLAVAKTWRRRGVGTALTREAERWSKSRGANWVELGVYEFNEQARSFYRALGYLPVSTKLRKPLGDGG